MGYAARVPLPLSDRAARIGEPMFLHTRMIVREESLNLYGFRAPSSGTLRPVAASERRRAAAALCGHLSHLAGSAADGGGERSAGRRCRVPGVGRKTAEKIIFQLRRRWA